MFYIFGFVVCLVLMNGKINHSITISSAQYNSSDLGNHNASRDLVHSHYNQYRLMMDRQINSGGTGERQKFRWLYKSFETSIYSVLERELPLKNIGKYLVLMHYTVIMFLSFLLSIKIFDFLKKLQHKDRQIKITNAVIFFSIYQFVLLSTNLNEWFTFIELFALLLAIYSSLKKNIFLLIVAIILGVSNRESGMVLGLVYPLLHYKNMSTRFIFLLITLPFVFFSIINYDIVSEFYRLVFYGALDDEFRVSLFKLSTFSYVTIGELINYFFTYVVFLFPLIYMLTKLPKSDLTNWARSISAMYILIILFGSYIGNFILLLLLLPSYILVFSIYQEKVV
jgi:hypothetical protein